MKFISLKLVNFRAFRKSEIEFSTSEEKNVTFVIGNNATGKTTLAQAFEWCLFGKCSLHEDVCSTPALDAANEGCEIPVSVELKLKSHDTYYVFKRTFYYVKKNGNVRCKSKTFEGIEQPLDGEATTLGETKALNKLALILPEMLAKFVFFSGEAIDRLANEVKNHSSSDHIREAVKTLLGTGIWENALQHLVNNGHVQSYQSVNRLFELDLKKLNVSEEFNRLIVRKQELEEIIREKETLIQDERNKINVKNEEIRKQEKLLNDNQEAAKLQKERDTLQNKIEKDQQLIEDLAEQAKDLLRKNLFTSVSKHMIVDVLTELKNEKLVEEIVPHITADTIDYLIQRGRCICGTPLDTSGVALQELQRLRNQVPPESIASSIGRFREKIRGLYEDSECDELSEKCADIFEKISEANVRIQEANGTLEVISRNLSNGANFPELIKRTEKCIQSLKENVSKSEVTIGVCNDKLDEANKERKSIDYKLQSYKQNSDAGNLVTLCMRYTQAVADRIRKDYEARLDMIRQNLDREVKEQVKNLGFPQINTTLDENYLLSYTNSDSSRNELSTAQSLVIGLACITGIISLGRKIVNQDRDASKTIESVPLVMDAPSSAFDRSRVGDFGSVIPKVAEQLIVFIKDTDGVILRDAVKSRIGKEYRLQQEPGKTNETCIICHED